MLSLRFISVFASLLVLAPAEQFVIPEVAQAVQAALGENPLHEAYTGPVKPSSKSDSTSAAEFHVNDASTPYWLESISHQGVSAFGPSGYTVFRNVKNFGAKGDGVTDDTAAIQSAIASGNRCGQNCASSTETPAVVYFPAGTYIISSPIFDYYYTMLIGNANNMPTLKAASNFNGGYIIDADPYFTSNLNWGSTNVFMRQVRNLVFDTTAVAAGTSISGIHWPTAQATSLQNLVFNMNSGSGTKHQGVFCESGSAGFMTDLTFNGGNIGLAIGNQQFTVRGCTFNNVVTAISHYWDWGFSYHGLSINNCQTGIDITAGGSGSQSVGSIVLFDSTITNTPVGVKTAFTSSSSPATAGTVVLENVVLQNVPVAVQDNGATALSGGSTTISAWGQGHQYTTTSHSFLQGSITANNRPSSLLSGSRFYTRSKPQYNTLAVSSFKSARSSGAVGNGVTDDTTNLQNAINSAASAGQVLFIDAGTYRVTNTLTIPAGSKIVGEAYSVIMSSGSYFSNMNSPQPVIKVGSSSGQSGQVELSDLIIATQGAQAGATLIEWNLATSGTPSGMWDVHTRVGGFMGSDLQVAECPTSSAANAASCIGAYMHMHVTSGAANLYMENNWLWTADHDIDSSSNTQITIYSGRGLLVESTNGPLWLWGTSVEHSVLYQYQLSSTSNIFAGFIQTETPYYQPSPNALTPFPVVSSLHDPNFSQSCANQPSNCAMAWGLRVVGSSNVLIYGAGLYSFFNNYSTTCSNQGGTENCQTNMVSLEGTNSNVRMYALSTIGAQNMVVTGGTNSVARYSDNVNVFPDTIAVFTV